MLPTKLYLAKGAGTHKENKNARDRASFQCGLQDINLVTVSSVLPAGVRLIDQDQFRDEIARLARPRPPGGIVLHAIHGICESNVPGQRVNSTLCCAIPKDSHIPGYVTELYEHPGIDDAVARRRTQTMCLQLFAERNGARNFDADSVWEENRAEYTIEGRTISLNTIQASDMANLQGYYTCALTAAVLLP